MTFARIDPVAILLQTATSATGQPGLVVGRRCSEDRFKGGWALIGGHVERGETAEAAAIREWNEETLLHLPESVAQQLVLTHSAPSSNGHLQFFLANHLYKLGPSDLERFKPTDEIDALRIVTEPEALVFPTHTEALQRFFALPHQRIAA